MLSSRDLGVQGVEAALPQRPIAAKPDIDVGERLWAQAVDPPLGFLVYFYETSLPQHPEVARDAGPGDGTTEASSPAVAGWWLNCGTGWGVALGREIDMLAR